MSGKSLGTNISVKIGEMSGNLEFGSGSLTISDCQASFCRYTPYMFLLNFTNTKMCETTLVSFVMET